MASAEEIITVLWSGEVAGDRLLLMPNERSVIVQPRLYFESNRLFRCNYTNKVYEPFVVNMIVLEYNLTLALRFDMVNSTYFEIYNVRTLATEDEYEPEEVYIDLRTVLDALEDRFIQCTIAAVIGIAIGVGIRRISK